MLATLHIRNLAVVDSACVEFGPGLNVLTGETGAGKSLIIGAFQLLLGERAGAHLVRPGAERCDLAAEVVLPPDPALREDVQRLLDEVGAPPPENDRIILRRTLREGSGRAFLNDTPVTLAVVRRLGNLLVDLHGPHEHQSLLRPACMRELLDRAADNQNLVEKCRNAWDRLRKLEADLEALEQNIPSPEHARLLESQLAEIESAELTAEDETLFERYSAASRARELIETVEAARRLLDDDEGSAAEHLASALRLLQQAAEMDGREIVVSLVERLEQAASAVHEIAADVADYAESLDIDPAELARMEERLNLLHRLRRKYGRTVQDILAAADSIRDQLHDIDEHGERLAALRHEITAARAEHAEICRKLHQRRTSVADELAGKVTEKLHRLAFLGARFAVRVAPAEPGREGADTVEFLFAPAPDAPLQPLRRIASSGEAARVMLAIKTVLGAADRIPILVFDEVDANVGGRAAVAVAEELRTVAAHRQVLCITHLPQIAAAADRHLRVVKTVNDGRTSADVMPLDTPERIEELVRMFGATEDSATARAHARQLLAQATGRPSETTPHENAVRPTGST